MDYFNRRNRNDDIRAAYSDLWIVIPITVIASLIAILLVLPVIIHRYCRQSCTNGFCYCCWHYSEMFVFCCGNLRPQRLMERFTVVSKSVQAEPLENQQGMHELDAEILGYQVHLERYKLELFHFPIP